jgi:hypothetical protein
MCHKNLEIEYMLSDVKTFLRAHLMRVQIEGPQLCPISLISFVKQLTLLW